MATGRATGRATGVATFQVSSGLVTDRGASTIVFSLRVSFGELKTSAENRFGEKRRNEKKKLLQVPDEQILLA